MNKIHLAEAVADRLGSSKKNGLAAVNAVLDEIMHQVGLGNKVTIPGFGTFEPTQRASRTARNPQTGTPVEVPASVRPKFTPGAAFLRSTTRTGSNP